jgi:hypothetical protein
MTQSKPTYADKIAICLVQALDFFIEMIIFGRKEGMITIRDRTPKWTREMLQSVEIQAVKYHACCNT